MMETECALPYLRTRVPSQASISQSVISLTTRDDGEYDKQLNHYHAHVRE